METLTLAVEQTTPTVKRTVARGRHKFIQLPSGTEKAIFSFSSGRQPITVIVTISAPRTARIALEGDSSKWLESFSSKNCSSCSKLAVPGKILESACAADPGLIQLNLEQLKAFLLERTKDACLGVNEHLEGSCPAGHNIAAGIEQQNVAVMKVPALCLISEYTSKENSSPFAFDRNQKYSLFAYKDLNNVPSISPYRPANVHSNGAICWGPQPIPRSPKQALAAYWGSGFNRDLASQAANTLKGTLENYEQLSTGFIGLKNYLLKDVHGTNAPCVGLYLSSFKNLLMVVPPEFHIKVKSETMVLGWVLSAEPNRYVLDCKGFLVEMNDLNGRASVKVLNSHTKTNEI